MTRDTFVLEIMSLCDKYAGVDLALKLATIYDNIGPTTYKLSATWTKEEIKTLLDMYANGNSYVQIAKALDKPKRAIGNKLYNIKKGNE